MFGASGAGLWVATATVEPTSASTLGADTISTFAGGGTSGIATQMGQTPLAVGVYGSMLYVSDDVNNGVVRAVDLATGIESPFAGGGHSLGDGGAATSASLRAAAITTDSVGNVYIADALNDRVRKVDISGIITTVAGTGAVGFSGDGGPATSASLSGPRDVVADSAGDLFIADSGNNRVRKVDATGVITTVAGDGTDGYSGDGGPALAADLRVWSVAVDIGGDLYIAEGGGIARGLGLNRIRRVDTSGTITTFAGQADAGFGGDGGPATAAGAFLNSPVAVRTDAAGAVYIADYNNRRVRKVDTSGTITTYAGGGGSSANGIPAKSGFIYSPQSITADSSGNLFIADYYLGRVRRVDHTTNLMTTSAGSGSSCSFAGDGGQALSAQLCNPAGLAFDPSDNLYLTDPENGRVRKIAPDGTISLVAGGGPGCVEPCAATTAHLSQPNTIALDASGDLFIADIGTNQIRRVDTSGTITTVAGTGTEGFSGDGGQATAAELDHPNGVAVDSVGNVLIADTNNQRVRRIDHLTGVISTVTGTGAAGFSGDGGPGTSALLNSPRYLAFNAAGDLLVSDSANNRVRRLSGGVITTFAGGGLGSSASPLGDGLSATSALLSDPQEVYVDGQGLIYIADRGDRSVRVVGQDGVISTVAGCDQAVNSGCSTQFTEGGSATAGQLYSTAVAVDSQQNAFVGFPSPQNAGFVLRVQAPTPPGSPGGVTATAGNSQVVVHWTAPVDNGNLVHGYSVTPYQGATPLAALVVGGAPTPTTATITRLNNHVPYTFTVAATNSYGSAGASTHSNAVVPEVTLPGNIATQAGSLGAGNALAVAQDPYALALKGSNVYIGDESGSALRSLSFPTGQETALAGINAFGYSGDGGPASAAMIGGVSAVAVCGSNTYFADSQAYVIRKIDSSGRISTVAGTGMAGYSGDNGPATHARLGAVYGIACRSLGGIYVSDSDNGAVRIINGSGIISTWFYGFGFPTGIIEMGSGQDFVAVADAATHVIWQLYLNTPTRIAGTGLPGNTGDNGPATSARLNQPWGLAEFFDTIYVADRGSNVIREFQPGGDIVPFAGTGQAGFSGDAGGALNAQLQSPTALAIGAWTVLGTSDNVLFVADSGNFRVRAITMSNPTITTIAGNGTPSLSGDAGPAVQAQMGTPYAVATDSSGNQYVADFADNAIREVTADGLITTVAGDGFLRPGYSGDHGSAAAAQLNGPRGVAVDSDGNIYISDTGNNVIRKVDHSNQIITTIAGNGTAGYSGDGGVPTAAMINAPRHLAVDTSGNIYFADTGNNRVREIDHATGRITTVAGTGAVGFSGDGVLASGAALNQPRGVAVSANGDLFISDSGNNRVRKVDHVSDLITTVAGDGVSGAGRRRSRGQPRRAQFSVWAEFRQRRESIHSRYAQSASSDGRR